MVERVDAKLMTRRGWMRMMCLLRLSSPPGGLTGACSARPRTSTKRMPEGVIDHERCLRMDSDVAVLGRGVRVEPGDVDGAQLGVVAAADWLVLRRPVGCHRGYASLVVVGEVRDVGVVEWHQIATSSGGRPTAPVGLCARSPDGHGAAARARTNVVPTASLAQSVVRPPSTAKVCPVT